MQYLWNTIRDFYVNYVFGGLAKNYNSNANNFNYGYGLNNGTTGAINGSQILLPINNDISLTFADWLSTTATIVTLIVIVSLCFFFIWRLFKFVSGAILLK